MKEGNVNQNFNFYGTWCPNKEGGSQIPDSLLEKLKTNKMLPPDLTFIIENIC